MNRGFLESIAKQLSVHFNKTLTLESYTQVYGGDINEFFIIHTSAEKYFLKVNNHAAKDMFEKESNGLGFLIKFACIGFAAAFAIVKECDATKAKFLCKSWAQKIIKNG